MTFDQFWQREKIIDGYDRDSVGQTPSGVPAATSLVPLEHFHSVTRIRFISGVVLGVLVSLSAAIPASKYYYSRRNTAAPGEISGQSNASNSNRLDSGDSNSGTATLPDTLPSASDPFVNTPEQAYQREVKLGRLAANHWAGLSLPVRSQTPALIAAHQPASGNTSPRPRGMADKPASGANSADSLEKLWSGVQAGNLNSTLKLADLYARGDGVTANCPQARVLLLMAAKKGSAEATRRLQQLDKACPATPSE